MVFFRHQKRPIEPTAGCNIRIIAVLRDQALRYGKKPELWGIELLNEPRKKFFQGTVRKFYRQSYAALDPLLHDQARIVFSDAFMPRRLSGALGGKRRAVLDVHWYHFTAPTVVPLRVYFWIARHRASVLRQLAWQQPVIVGEWSGILMEKKLAGIGKKWRQTLINRHLALQQKAYQPALGSFYWTYKAHNLGAWDFRAMVESGQLKLPK